MTNTASQFVDFGATSTMTHPLLTKELIEFSLKRQERNESGAVDADLHDASRRATTDVSAFMPHMQTGDPAIPMFPRTKLRPRPTLVPLQEWEGYVVDISGDGFTARLVDMTRQESFAAEEADFDLEDIADPDRDLLREGAIFRWTIGYETAPSGSKKRVSQLVFRRLPKWTRNEIAQADRDADDLLNGINWE